MSLKMMAQISKLEASVEECKELVAQYEDRIKKLEHSWNVWRKKEKVYKNTVDPIPVPPRPDCIEAAGYPFDENATPSEGGDVDA